MPKGSIRQRGKKWYYRFFEDGKVIERCGGDKKEDALKALNEELNRKYKGYTRPEETKLKDYLNMWLENYILDEKSENTYDKYNKVITNKIIPSIGDIRLCDLKAIHVDKFLRDLKKSKIKKGKNICHLSGTTIQMYYGILNAALNRAVKLQMIIENPCKYIDTPKRNKYKASILTLQEFRLIYNSLNDTLFEDYIFKLALDISIETGLRRGELCGLTWDSINFEDNFIDINKALIRIENQYSISKLKTEGSYRTIPISDELAQKLKKHKTIQSSNKLKYGEFYKKVIFNKISYDLIFRHENGDYIIPSTFLQRLKRLCRYNKIDKNIRWHDLRHTNATYLIESGVNLKVVQDRLGHSLMQTTADTYSHVTKKMNREATTKLTSLIHS
ncbi:Tyrosine recombinase XerC [bioreactor metagenome]|jgi:integrase|uniref:Tyrosine recombinase XerC n=1 Tax=bioreactor metagenome TaxID=1076179 RepID=A0A644WCM9_9ZZZZ|nr:site-specific integrase [Clostridium sp.]MBS5886014.1 site-specific integrase [Clostridium sp.]